VFCDGAWAAAALPSSAVLLNSLSTDVSPPTHLPPPSTQVKGSTLLYGNRASSQEELLAVAEAEAASTALWKAKRQMKRDERDAARSGRGGDADRS
jgi:hypothetical protein